MVKGSTVCLVCLFISYTCCGSKNITVPDATNYSFSLARAKIGLVLAQSLINSQTKSETCNILFKRWLGCSEHLEKQASIKNLDTLIRLMGAMAGYTAGAGAQASDKPVDILAQKYLQFAQTATDWSKFNPSGLDGPTKELYQEIYKNNG